MESPAHQIESILFDTATIQHRVSELGAEISARYSDGVTLIGILTGALYFLTDLSRVITCPVEIDLISVASYAGTDSSETVTLLKDLDREIADRHVIIVEDIVDTGRTLNTLLALLADRHPASLRVCTLLNKPDRRVVPARRKFLKGVDTEFRHIVNTVTAMALAYSKIGFDLKHNGRTVLHLGRSDFDRRAERIFGVTLGVDAVGVQHDSGGIDVRGFVGKPETARKSGAQQVLIVNRRWVQHKAIAYAIYEGYGGLLPKGLAPSYCLCLTIDPARVDVNVHPSKREVRFADERAIYSTIGEAVRQALRHADLIPEIGEGDVPAMSTMMTPAEALAAEQAEGVAELPLQPYHPQHPSQGVMGSEPQMALPLTVRRPSAGGQEEVVSPLDTDGLATEDFARVSVWQLHHTYILAHIKNGMIVIDQQIAHQRVLYENAIDNLHAHPATSQRMLFPLTLDFGVKEIHLVREAIPLLEKMGFGIRDFGGNTVVVDAIPVGLRAWHDGQLLRDMVSDMAESESLTSVPPAGQDRQITPREHRLAAAYAWHTSIRGGEELSTQEMRSLIDQLFATREPFICPYGRPTLTKIGLDEIANRFKR